MAGLAGTKVGIGGVVYRNTGSYGSPTWTAQTAVKDVNFGQPWDFGDASTRATRAKLYAKTQVDLAISLVVKADNLESGYQAMVTAAMSPTSVLDFLILDGLVSAEVVHGIRSEFLLSQTGQSQAIGDVIYDTFDLKPSYTTNGVPSWVVTAANSVTTITAY